MQLLLSQWELDRPTIAACELTSDLQAFIPSLCNMDVLKAAPNAAAWTCKECGVRSQLQFLIDKDRIAHAFSCCPDCGPNKIDSEFLKRWVIDTSKLLQVLFCDTKLSIQERRSNHLWQIGRASWAGRSRDIWFVRNFRSSNEISITGELESWPKAIIFTPTVTMADRIRANIGNLVISLDEVIEYKGGDFHLDSQCIESRIQDREQSSKTKKSITPKRGTRLAGAEKLRDEIIDHLITARDYAFETKQRTGEPELLPRPLQNELAKRTGLHVSAVSRCLNDKDNHELQLLWNMADNLDEVMKWATPKKRKRKS